VSSPSENVDVLAAPADALAPSPVEGGEGFTFPADAQPKLIVTRGLKQNLDYPLYAGQNFIGRADEKPVDVDLDDQEPPDRVWSSRQHALILFENGVMTIEDLNSANGTFVNRAKLNPGTKQTLKPDDVIQIGTVQLKVQG
jgi:pSer/pThr/pTyr-binding forkhead associated (FHA) protein